MGSMVIKIRKFLSSLLKMKCRVCGNELWMGKCPYRFTSKHGGSKDGKVT